MVVKQLAVWASLVLLIGCTPNSNKASFHLTSATVEPALLGKGLLSTGLNERDFTLSPAGDHLLFSRQSVKGHFSAIYEMRKTQNTWTFPQMVSFSGSYSDLEPSFSPDGKWLYFASNRPKDGTGTYPSEDFDIWRISVHEKSYGIPERLSDSLNTPFDEFYPCVTQSGNVYFTSTRGNSWGKEDIFVSVWEKESYRKAIPLPSEINTDVYEFNAYVSPNEDLILFTSYGRAKGPGEGDLYYATKDRLGFWKKAKLLPSTINSPQLDYCPWYSTSDSLLIFTSKRHRFQGKQAFGDSLTLNEALRKPKNGLGDLYKVKWWPN